MLFTRLVNHCLYLGEFLMETQTRNRWNWGFNASAEIWNGRLAMLGFLIAVAIELFSGRGLLHFWGLM